MFMTPSAGRRIAVLAAAHPDCPDCHGRGRYPLHPDEDEVPALCTCTLIPIEDVEKWRTRPAAPVATPTRDS